MQRGICWSPARPIGAMAPVPTGLRGSFESDDSRRATGHNKHQNKIMKPALATISRSAANLRTRCVKLQKIGTLEGWQWLFGPIQFRQRQSPATLRLPLYDERR